MEKATHRYLLNFPKIQTDALVVCIENKSRNHSINLAKNQIYDKGLIYKQPRQDLGLCGFSFLRDLEKSFSQVWKRHVGALPRGTNIATVKQKKHLSLSFATETKDY